MSTPDPIPAEYIEAAEHVVMRTEARMRFMEPEDIDALKADFARAIHAAVKAEQAKNVWQDISTAPKDSTFVLVYEPVLHGIALAAWQGRHANAQWYGVDSLGLRFESAATETRPTHWMPLPEPPHPTTSTEGEE